MTDQPPVQNEVQDEAENLAKVKIIFALLLFGALVLVARNYFSAQSVETAPVYAPIYASEAECEQAEGRACDFVTCDYVPKGKTTTQVCGKNFKKGWQPI